MTIEEIWQELEAEPKSNLAWTSRFARAEPGYPLLVAFEPVTRTRALLIPTTKSALPPRRDWPECEGLELISVSFSTHLHLGIRLRDPQCADVFSALAEDVSPRIADADGPHSAGKELLARLRRWQQFLSIAKNGLSIEAQRGLWGELHALSSHLIPAIPATEAIIGWKASSAAHQDFQFNSLAIEIKTTTAKQPQSIRITSERQLDEIGAGQLYLHVIIVDEREVASDTNAAGRSLSGIITEIRTAIKGDAAALREFNERLLDAGWLDCKASRYEGRRWTARREISYRVSEGFPRLTERDLRVGIGDVSYALNLAACEPFVVPTSDIISALTQYDI